ncbi:MAG: tetratricopeptide repeat protein [Treponema sp.]|jgi:tetratricopeptide (TPR) repeat protein|nr:tetratricopeptide repeat protein [Treponema sp.]
MNINVPSAKIFFWKGAVLAGGALLVLLILPVLFSCSTGPAETVKPVPERPEEAPEELPPLTDTQSILARMAVLLDRGDYDGALELFDLIDAVEAESVGIRLLKASVLSSAGRLTEARAIAEDISSKEPSNLEALFVLSAIEGASGKEREQRTILERIIKIDPANPEALSALGTIALRARSLRTAASYFDRALAAEPDNQEALIGRAGVYRYDRDPKNAEALLNKAVTLYPQWAVPYSERARLYQEAGFPKEALADLDRAKALDGGDYWIAVDRGTILIDLNRKPEALEEFTRAIALDPSSFLAYVYSAGIKDELGDYDGAERDYETLSKLKPEYYFAFEGLGMHKMRRGLWAEARDAFLEAYKQAPQESVYALLAAMNWMRAGRPNEPRQFLEQALRGVQRESLEWYMFRLYHDLSGDTDVAIRIDREQNTVTKARMLYYLANYYDIRGNKNLADKYFLQVQDLNQKATVEWRLNEWALEQRNLKAY